MANESELSNFKFPTDVVSDAMTPALVNPVVVAPLLRYEAIPLSAGTKVRNFRKDGSLTSEEINESAVQAVDGAEQEITQSVVAATCVKLAATCFLTVEAQDFGGITLADIARYIGEAIGRDWDDELLGTFSSPSTSVTASSVLTVADVLQAAYNVRANTSGVANGRLIGVFDYKGVYEIQKELTASSAAHLSIPSEVQLLAGVTGVNGYVGSKAGIDFYQTSGLPTSSSDDVAIICEPSLYWGAINCS